MPRPLITVLACAFIGACGGAPEAAPEQAAESAQEIRVAKIMLEALGLRQGVRVISCPTCGRIEADLVSAVAEVERRTAHIKTPMDVSVMGCVVNAIGEAKHADVAIAYGKGSGLVMLKGEVVARLPEGELVERFVQEVEKFAEDNK